MPDPVSNLDALLRTMNPVLNPGSYVFASVPSLVGLDPDAIVASIREAEGLSIVVEESFALRLGLRPLGRCAWITLTVTSDLAAVGLTAAFSAALAREGIGCNVVAGALHDHLFVPAEHARRALQALEDLQARAVEPGEVQQ